MKGLMKRIAALRSLLLVFSVFTSQRWRSNLRVQKTPREIATSFPACCRQALLAMTPHMPCPAACLADTGRQGVPGTRPQGWEKWIPCLQQAGRLMHAGMTGVMLVFAIPQLRDRDDRVS